MIFNIVIWIIFTIAFITFLCVMPLAVSMVIEVYDEIYKPIFIKLIDKYKKLRGK